MKKYSIFIGILMIIVICLLLMKGCGASVVFDTPSTTIDTDTLYYQDTLETALNNGENFVGATVIFRVKKYSPNSSFGYNLIAGEHLNFCSDIEPIAKVGDIAKAKITKIKTFLGSWIIYYSDLQIATDMEQESFVLKFGEFVEENSETTNTKIDSKQTTLATNKNMVSVDKKDAAEYKYITIKDLDTHCSDIIGENVIIVDKVARYDSKDKTIKISVPNTYHYYSIHLADDSIADTSKIKDKMIAVVGTVKEDEIKTFVDASIYNAYIISIGDDSTQYTQESTSNTLANKFTLQKSEIKNLSEDDYKANCTSYTSSDHNKILRNPNQYKDKLAKISGKVNQTIEGLFGLYTTIYVKDSAGNIWGVNYTYGDDESHKLNGDSIEVWGNLDGTATVDNVLGVQQTLPYISAKYVK